MGYNRPIVRSRRTTAFSKPLPKVEPADNKCSKAKAATVLRRKPGASPLLFGEFLMQLCAFVFLEDISGELPPYEETYLSVPMDLPMREAYHELEDEIRKALKAHRGNRSVLSTMLNTLLSYPDHPYGFGTLYGTEFDAEFKRKVQIRHCRPRRTRRRPKLFQGAHVNRRDQEGVVGGTPMPRSLLSTRTSTTLRRG